MACKICEARRPRRYCPGVGGDICTVCCGTEREQTVHCPLDCAYLEEARMHEKTPEPDPSQWPDQDVKVSREFLIEHTALFTFLASQALQAGLGTPGATDYDVREALSSLIRTYRTRESGLYYDTRPANLLAAGIYERLRQAVEQWEAREKEQRGMSTLRDADLLGLLVFLERLELQHNNGRKLSRAFLDFLRQNFSEAGTASVAAAAEQRLIVP